MTFDVDMSCEQFFECNRLVCVKTTAFRRMNYLAMQYGYPLLALFFAWVGVWTGMHQSISAAVLPFAISAFFFWYRIRFPARWRMFYEKQAQGLVGTMTATSDGLKYERRDGSAILYYTWNGFESWLERSDMFLLLTPSLMFFRIPKGKLTGEEQDQVHSWISAASERID